jgi:tetratricopeptide (TPR) repeat protein
MLAQRIVRDPPPPDSIKKDLPGFAVRLCSRLLELKPTRRFQSANDVVRAIDEKHVPSQIPRQRYVVTAVAACAALLMAGGIVEWRRQHPAQPSAAAITQDTTDIAPMPFTVTSDLEADDDFAVGIRELLTNSLIDINRANSEDMRRVDRALKELTFDAEAARRQRTRVAETLNTRRLLEGDLHRDASGSYSIRLSLWEPTGTGPVWSQATPPTSEEMLPSALRDLRKGLLAELRLPAGDTATWPGAKTARLVGRLYSEKKLDELNASALTKAAQEAKSPNLWWSIQEALDRTGRLADVASIARQAKDALASDPSREATRARAYASVLLGENEQAVALLGKLVAEAPSDHPARRLLARAKSELGQYEDASKILQALVAEDPRNEDAWFDLGKYAILAGDSKRAVDDYLSRAQVLANRLDDKRMQANVIHAMAIGFQNLGQLSLAGDYFEQAIQKRKALNDMRGVAVSLRNLSTVLAVQGDFKGAQKALNDARSLLEPLGDNAALADLANDDGVLKEERGDYRGALDSYRGALAMYQTLGNSRQIAGSLLNVGFAYYQVGEFDNAQVYWNQAASTYEKANDFVGIVHAKQSLGLAETARGNFALARETLNDSLRQAEELQMAEERSISLANLADLDRVVGDIGAALDHGQKALDEFKQREDSRGIVEMKLARAAAYRDVGDWDSAATAIADLAEDNVANSEQAAMLLWRHGEIALGRGDNAAALAKANEAVAAGQSAHSYGTELSARLLKARALHAQRRAKEASAELATIRAGLAKYASVPLRLQLAETALQVNAAAALPDYRAARAELARLPAYGRAFEIHALGAAAQNKQSEAGEGEAMRAAKSAYEDLLKNTPPAQRAALAALAGAYGLQTDASHE